jgi:two-component system copper resistance phosphate regulon response regulator CusR
MLTARSATLDIVHGLDHGADDYLTKPFAFDELLARVRSLLRRGTQKILKVSNLQLDTVSRKATRDGSEIILTAREFALLNLFMINAGNVLTREQIGKDVWGYDFDPGTNIVDVYVNHLRNKIDTNHTPKLLHTLRGKGYLLSENNPKKV